MIETAVLMCHAPIVVPEVGGERGRACLATTRAMARAARHLASGRPDVLVVLSPHARRDPRCFAVSAEPQVAFHFARFGVPELTFAFSGAPSAAKAITASAQRLGLEVKELQSDPRDHGAAVPLAFVARQGLDCPVVIVALPYPATEARGKETEVRFGQALRDAANALGQRWSILASGDLSHALQVGSPNGFHPSGRSFDEAFTQNLSRGDLRGACSLQPELLRDACEDAVASTAVAAGATGFDARGHALWSYEGPFGVGYAEALLFDASAPPQELAVVARDAVKALLEGRDYEPPEFAAPWSESRAVFVTLREHDGALRGCIGRLEPNEKTLGAEVATTARSAASRDPRFPPVAPREFESLRFEVSVLGPAERVSSLEELDPEEYGVIVSAGERRGVLLPEVNGVDEATEQVRIACQKAHIDPTEPHTVARFRVHKVRGAEA